MSEIKFSLPGQETVTLTGQTIDKLIRAGDGDAALLYLYILKTKGQSTTQQTAAELGKGQGWIASAMAVLSRLGLVRLDGKEGADSGTEQADLPLDEPPDASRRYTVNDVKRELAPGSPFSSVLNETQRSLGRILTPDELLRLFGIYDALRLPPEVILQLITHCITECRLSSGRVPTVRYIEKAAYTWEREGVVTLERAEEYIKSLEVRRSLLGEIKRVMQIRDREFSKTERHYVDSWVEMGFDAGAIAIAYDKTVVKTGKMAWPYMDTILKSWHGRGAHTAKEVQKLESWPPKPGAHDVFKTPGQKFGSANQEELARMQRFLDRLKEE